MKKNNNFDLDLHTSGEGYFLDYMPSKGCFPDAKVTFEGTVYLINIISPVRLMQDIEAELKCNSIYYFEKNILVIAELTVENIKAAIDKMITTGQIYDLVKEA